MTGNPFVTTIALAALLAGCGLAKQAQLKQDADARKLQLAQDTQECERRYPGQAPKPVTPKVKCMNAANIKYYHAMERSRGSVPLDLIRVAEAQSLLAAERYDKGKLSEAEYLVESAKVQMNLNTQYSQRQNNAAAVAAQQQAAAAQQSQAAIARGRAIQDAFKPNTQTTNTNCNRVGNSVNCSSTSY